MNSDLAREVSGRMTAHSVRDDGKAANCKDAVLIHFSHPTYVGCCPNMYLKHLVAHAARPAPDG